MYCECGCGNETRVYEKSTGRYRKGEHARFCQGHSKRVKGNRKLNYKQVEKIKLRLAQGYTHRELARSYGVSSSTITYISVGRTWADVPWPIPKPVKDLTPPNPSGKCFCGCGQTTPIAKQTDRATKAVKGEHTRFVRYHAGWGYNKRQEYANRMKLKERMAMA